MPIYEYRCESCGHTLDALQKISDDPLQDCPECETAALKRLISAPAFRLKGGGWYETDFKSDKEKKRNLADGKAQPEKEKADKADKADKSEKTDKKGDGKTDSTAKSDTKTAKSPAKSSGSEAA